MSGNWQTFPGATDQREATAKHRGLMPKEAYAKLATYPDDAGSVFDAPATDANGWAVQYLPSGKRLWTRTHTWGVAAFGRAVVASLALPVGLATVGDGTLTWGWYGTLAGGSPGSQLYRPLLEMGDTSATIEVVEGTTSGVACNTVMATVWLNLTIVEG